MVAGVQKGEKMTKLKFFSETGDQDNLVEFFLNPFQHIGASAAAFENIVQNEQFLLLLQCFQHHSIFLLSILEIFIFFSNMISKSSAADKLYVGKIWQTGSIKKRIR